MKHTLVGHTGFVGGNLANSHDFDNVYNSSSIEQSFGRDNGLVVYSGMASEKFLADKKPKADFGKAEVALNNLRNMSPQQVVLISTVDVYRSPVVGVYEDTLVGGDDMPAYGRNRAYLEMWVRDEFPTALIVRLPALFGQGLKKNFIYDMLSLCPPMLKEQKYEELSKDSPIVKESYKLASDGFYRMETLKEAKRRELKAFFEGNDFNSLKFTDSRSMFQFYNLSRLWKDISACLNGGIRVANMAVEPLSAADLYKGVFGTEFENHLDKPPFSYDMKTSHADWLDGEDGYLATAEEVVQEVREFAKDFAP